MAFRPHYGICTGTPKFQGCGNNGLIKTKRMLCPYCDAKYKKGKKEEKNMNMDQEKDVSMLQLFLNIWEERKPGFQFNVPDDIENLTLDEYLALVSPYRVCFVTLQPIKVFRLDLFSHCLTKRTWGKMKKDKRNIVLVQPFIHTIWEFESRDKLKDYPGYNFLLELTQRLKEEYPKL